MKKQSRRETFATFKQEFSQLCEDWNGVHSSRDSITPESPAYRFDTPLGVLCASIHAPRDWHREEILPGSIYMRFHTYSGPVAGPGVRDSDFNRFSHKWNIHFSGDAYGARQAALLEFYARLSKLMATETVTKY
jgi:hypothetical protein